MSAAVLVAGTVGAVLGGGVCTLFARASIAALRDEVLRTQADRDAYKQELDAAMGSIYRRLINDIFDRPADAPLKPSTPRLRPLRGRWN